MDRLSRKSWISQIYLWTKTWDFDNQRLQIITNNFQIQGNNYLTLINLAVMTAFDHHLICYCKLQTLLALILWSSLLPNWHNNVNLVLDTARNKSDFSLHIDLLTHISPKLHCVCIWQEGCTSCVIFCLHHWTSTSTLRLTLNLSILLEVHAHTYTTLWQHSLT